MVTPDRHGKGDSPTAAREHGIEPKCDFSYFVQRKINGPERTITRRQIDSWADPD
jgi:hypothetical protein